MGHYRSGASLSYARILEHLSAAPERGSPHNTFLQQLFDGGIVGAFLLFGAFYLASVRYARNLAIWGRYATCAIVAVTISMMSSIAEVSLAPGAYQEPYWIMLLLVWAACQSGISQDAPIQETGEMNTRSTRTTTTS